MLTDEQRNELLNDLLLCPFPELKITLRYIDSILTGEKIMKTKKQILKRRQLVESELKGE